MSFKAIVRGNLVSDATTHTRNEKNFTRYTIADNDQKGKDKNKKDFYITCFDYTMGAKRMSYFTTGSHVLITGNYTDELVIDPNTNKEKIERSIYVFDAELISSTKKNEK